MSQPLRNPRSAQILELLRRHPPENAEDRDRWIRGLAGNLCSLATALPGEEVSPLQTAASVQLLADLMARVKLHRDSLAKGAPMMVPATQLRIVGLEPTDQIFEHQHRVCRLWSGLYEGERAQVILAGFCGPAPEGPITIAHTAGISWLAGPACRIWVDVDTPGRIALVARCFALEGGRFHAAIKANLAPMDDTPPPRPIFTSRIPETCFN